MFRFYTKQFIGLIDIYDQILTGSLEYRDNHFVEKLFLINTHKEFVR